MPRSVTQLEAGKRGLNMNFDHEELMLMMLYNTGTRLGLIHELRLMQCYLMPDETALRELSEQVIEKLKALLESDEEENKQDAVRELMREWNEIGFVPFKEKDKIYKAYHETVDQLFKALNMSAARRRLDNFKNNLKNDAKEGGQGLSRERERLVRAYENNLGFLTCSSKKGSNLLNEMNKKMEKLKDELNLIGEKIAAIDKEMSAQAE